MGAGLGGGSADGSAMLQLLNELFRLNISVEKLIEYALQLGSDCPFFIYNCPSYASGRGELLEPLALSLKGYALVISNPGIHVNTGWAFSQINVKEKAERPSLKECCKLPVSKWADVLINDFEPVVFKQYPTIAQLKAQFYQAGALYACMSGSGSTVFAIFNEESVNTALLPSGCTLLHL